MSAGEKNILRGFLLFILIVLVAVGVTVYTQIRPSQQASAVVSAPTPEAVPTIISPVIRTTTIHSGDGTKQLVLKETAQAEGTKEFSITTSDLNGENPHVVVTRTTGAGVSMMLPFNAWDPTDSYFFIGITTGGTPNYLVFKADGTAFANGEQYIDVGKVWAEKGMTPVIREATGWASGTLLIVYTTAADGSHGPAFWFEIPSTYIIQLAG